MNKFHRFIALSIMVMTGLCASAQSAEYQKKADELMKSSYGDFITETISSTIKAVANENKTDADEEGDANAANAANVIAFFSSDKCTDAITKCLAVIAEKKLTIKEMDHIIDLYSNPKTKPQIEKCLTITTEIMPDLMQLFTQADDESLPEIKKAQCSQEYRDYFTKNIMKSDFSFKTTITTTTQTTDGDGNEIEKKTKTETSEDNKMANFMNEYMTELMLDKVSKSITLKELKQLNKIFSDPAVEKLQDASGSIMSDPQCQSILGESLGKFMQQNQ